MGGRAARARAGCETRLRCRLQTVCSRRATCSCRAVGGRAIAVSISPSCVSHASPITLPRCRPARPIYLCTVTNSSRALGLTFACSGCKPAEIVPGIKQRRSVLGSGDINGDTDRNEAPNTASRWRCLCLGLGPPTTSEIARAQLCVLLDLCTELGIVSPHGLDSVPSFARRCVTGAPSERTGMQLTSLPAPDRFLETQKYSTRHSKSRTRLHYAV